MQKKGGHCIYKGLCVQVTSDVRRLLCRNCGELPEKPVQTCPDGYLYCEQCRTPDGDNTFRDRAVGREIQNLQCICVNALAGCKWKGELRSLFEHEWICGLASKKHLNKASTFAALIMAVKYRHYKELSVLKHTDSIKLMSDKLSTRTSSGCGKLIKCITVEDIEGLIDDGSLHNLCSDRFYSEDRTKEFQILLEIKPKENFLNFHLRVVRLHGEADGNEEESTFVKGVKFEVLMDGFVVLQRNCEFWITKTTLPSILTTGGKLVIRVIIDI